MKVPELREKLNGMSQKELVYLVVEFYKLIPKAKREMYQLDAMTDAPTASAKPPKLIGAADSMSDLNIKIREFDQLARDGYYFRRNNTVPRKVRNRWRSDIKAWYKALISTNRPEGDLETQIELLKILYFLLHRGTQYATFSSQDPFGAINVSRGEFYKSILQLMEEANGKSGVITKGLPLMIEAVSSYYYDSALPDSYLQLIQIPDLYDQTIEQLNEMLETLYVKKIETAKDKRYSSRTTLIPTQINMLAELGLKVYIRLGEQDNGIQFFMKNHQEEDKEVKLYMLIMILLAEQRKDLIVQEIDKAQQNKIKIRPSLRVLYDYILQNDALPDNV